jgi:predicted flap endonuclease-1-like 5' DNA nuclease
MRTDYILYAVAVILFIITGIVAVYQMEFQQLWVVATAVLGIFFAGLGYSQRPRSRVTPIRSESPPPPIQPIVPVVTTKEEEPGIQHAVMPVSTKEEKPVVVETPKPALELTSVKGVKTRRAEQLKSLGINNVEDLANASPKDLAAKLKIAEYFTEEWIKNAKELLGKA